MDGLFDAFSDFTQIAISAAINSLPLFVVVFLVTVAGQKWLSARARFALWTLVFVRMILPISFETPFGWGQFSNYWTPPRLLPAEILRFDEPTSALEVPVISEGTSQPTIKQNWIESLMTAVGFGLGTVSLLLALWLIGMSLYIACRVRGGATAAEPAWDELLAEGRRKFGIRVTVRLRLLSDWNTPATLGFLRPVIILPADAATLSASEMRHVLWHELAHIQRGDAAWNYLWIAVRCLQWWNPCFWYSERAWLSEREMACDAMVIKHLDSLPCDYGKTLLRFLERLAQSSNSVRGIPLLGLVMFLGQKALIERRLKTLTRPMAVETAAARWCSFALLILLAAMGLTDASESLEKHDSAQAISVPPETRWEFHEETVGDPSPTNLETVTIAYDIRGVLDRIRQDEPEANGQYWICDTIEKHRGIFPWIDGSPPMGHCQLRGDTLLVSANRNQHELIQQSLSHWAQFGQTQIAIEVRMVTSRLEPTHAPPHSGGRIVSPPAIRNNDDFLPEYHHHSVSDSLMTPSFICTLSSAEAKAATIYLQRDHRTCLLYAPKVTIFSGQSANVFQGAERPFVTGLRTTDIGSREAHVSLIEEGVRIRMKATAEAGDRIAIKFQLRELEVADVEVLKTRITGESTDTCIQVPHLRESNLKTSVNLADGETILIAPLRRDRHGEFHIYLVTPRLIR